MSRVRMNVVAIAIVGAGLLIPACAEPANFGVNGPIGWKQKWVLVRHKKMDAFGDTYYTYTKEYIKSAVKKEVQKHKKAFKQAPQEILKGLNESILAFNALQKNNVDKAKKLLEQASNNFSKVLKSNPNLSLVPISQEIEINEFEGSLNDIKADITDAIKLLKHHQTQLARDILLPLEDEIDIVIRYIPMDIYPDVINQTLDLLNKGKKNSAIRLLARGFALLVSDEIVIPIPLIKSQDLVKRAENLYKKHPQKAIHVLDIAKKELQKAILLGYTKKHSKEYSTIYEEIMNIQNEIRKKGHPKNMFKTLKKRYSSLMKKTRSEKRRIKEGDNNWQGVAKAHQKAAEEELNDKLRFLEKEKSDIF